MKAVPIARLCLGTMVLVATAACSTGWYMYRPEENATASVSGHPAAYYQIPPESPRGDVRVAALGIASVERRGGDDHRVRAMHVRLAVANNDDSAEWEVDTRQQVGTFDHYGSARPAFAAATSGRPPIVPVAPGTSATIDLYYPLPRGMEDASHVPHFEVLWNVQTSDGPVSQRTTFERLRLESAPSPNYYAFVGWNAGPGWYGWYDPFWPGYAFAPPSVVYVHPPVNVAPPARRTR